MDLQLAGRTAIVTGGSRGIGFACAAALLAEGACVAIAARDPNGVQGAVAELGGGPDVMGVLADTTDQSQVDTAVTAVADRFGGVDILVNGAARRATSGVAGGYDEAELVREIDTKVLGYLRFAYAVAPLMAAKGWGRIINIGGIGARRSSQLSTTVRNVSVAAITKNLADEFGSSGINVTVVHPGLTRIDGRGGDPGEQDEPARQRLAERVRNEVSIGRMVTAAEVADVVAFLASPRSVAIQGDAVVVAGGMRGVVYY